MRFLLVAFGLLAGCSLVTSLDDLRGADGSTAPDAPVDALDAPAADSPEPDAAPPCDLTKPFAAPTPIVELNTAALDSIARLSGDELTVYFDRYPTADAGVAGGVGGSDLFMATRASRAAAFGKAVPLAINTANDESNPTFYNGGLELFYDSNGTGGMGSYDVWSATRQTTSVDFSNPGDLPAPVNGGTYDAHPYVTPSGLVLYFVSTRGGNDDLYRATRSATNVPFVMDTTGALAAVSSSAHDWFPVVTLDERTIYFASDRGSSGNLDVYVATRVSTSDPFSVATPVAELNTPAGEYPSWISEDGCRLYMTSDRAGSQDLFVAVKP